LFHIMFRLLVTPNQKISDHLRSDPINDILERTITQCYQHANMCTLFLDSYNITGVPGNDLSEKIKECGKISEPLQSLKPMHGELSMNYKFKVGDTAFFCQGKEVLDVGVVVDTGKPISAFERVITVRWQKLGKQKQHREDQIYTREEVYNENV
jgi:hypothetical protein